MTFWVTVISIYNYDLDDSCQYIPMTVYTYDSIYIWLSGWQLLVYVGHLQWPFYYNMTNKQWKNPHIGLSKPVTAWLLLKTTLLTFFARIDLCQTWTAFLWCWFVLCAFPRSAFSFLSILTHFLQDCPAQNINTLAQTRRTARGVVHWSIDKQTSAEVTYGRGPYQGRVGLMNLIKPQWLLATFRASFSGTFLLGVCLLASLRASLSGTFLLGVCLLASLRASLSGTFLLGVCLLASLRASLSGTFLLGVCLLASGWDMPEELVELVVAVAGAVAVCVTCCHLLSCCCFRSTSCWWYMEFSSRRCLCAQESP